MKPPLASVLHMVSSDIAWHYRVVPVDFRDSVLTLVTTEVAYSQEVKDELELQMSCAIRFELLPESEFNEILNSSYKKSRSTSKKLNAADKRPEFFLEEIISEAEKIGSSDIHIEIYAASARIRFRIDGNLVERYQLNFEDFPALINRIKIKANLDISEKRLPQDGRIEFSGFGKEFDIRVSTLPTLYGEKIVLRLLSKDSTNIEIGQLGMSTKDQEDYLQSIRKPHGLLLISGPTGSGKTTTLYATLKTLNEEKRNVITIEHPIEYTLEGINQVQLRENIGLTYASALRSFLRQDPDVIMIGEIRDQDTAEMAVRAALTGHLVLSTIHTNSAWGIISRLIDMGIPRFILAETINTVVAQRLVRTLCQHCKEPVDAMSFPSQVQSILKSNQKYYDARGCNHCFHTGYSGRKAIFEIVPIDHELTEKIKNKDEVSPSYLRSKGVSFLKDRALELLISGETSVDEVYPLIIVSD